MTERLVILTGLAWEMMDSLQLGSVVCCGVALMKLPLRGENLQCSLV